MKYSVSHPTKKIYGSITLTASKSESNRVLIIQALCKDKFEIKNLAAAQDTVTLHQILTNIRHSANNNQLIDVGAAGTTMRFLTAYCATQPGIHVITGSDRMKKRPIGILVKALRDLGADIEYQEAEGYPPLKIKGKTLQGGKIEMDGSVSSQFISALLLISPELQDGLSIHFKGEVTSRPYISMTLNMMKHFGVRAKWVENSIVVEKQTYHINSDNAYTVEADWSSASYWYAIAALSDEADITIKGLNSKSLQGDSILSDIFMLLGVKTEFIADGIRITKYKINYQQLGYDFSDCPDLAQTVAVVVSILNIPSLFNGLHTLRIKETDRIEALKVELKKLGTDVEIVNDQTIKIKSSAHIPLQPIIIATYEDHRMAMAFAPLALKLNEIIIEHPDVVKKSYPDFWNDLKSVGFVVEEVS